MMNETLKKELSKHLRVINDRDNFIRKWVEKKGKEQKQLGYNWEGEDRLIKLIHSKAKKYLDEKGFNYEKDRNKNGDRITFEYGFLKIRLYKHKSFRDISLGDLKNYCLSEFLPKGFNKAVAEFEEKKNKIGKLKIDFKKVIKLRKNNKINFIDDTKLKENKVTEITLYDKAGGWTSENLPSFEVDGDLYFSKEWAYYNPNIFNKILELMKNYDKNFNNILKIKEKLEREAEDFVNNQFDKILILENLED